MNVVKCKNGHYYNAEKYDLCPVCNSESGVNKKKNNNAPGKIIPPAGASKNDKLNDNSPIGNTDNSKVNSVQDASQSNTGYLRGTTGTGYSATFGNSAISMAPDEATSSVFEPVREMPVQEPVREAEKEEPDSENSLSGIIEQISASSDEKTVSYFSMMTGAASTSDNSVSANTSNQSEAQQNQHRKDPVVGWLLCIKGAHFGEDFRICAGSNSVGRSDSNRIVIKGDMSVSREKHAFITYDPKHGKFYVKPGDSSGLTYVNEEYIMETKPLMNRDIIEIGSSKFMFIQLCDESFKWEDYI